MNNCPNCASQLQWVEQYRQWYCWTCKTYQQPVQKALVQPTPPEHAAAPHGQPVKPEPVDSVSGYGVSTTLEYDIEHRPSFTAIIFHLKRGQSLVAEAGAMMYMDRSIEIQTSGRSGGIMKGLATSVLGGESFFVNTFSAPHQPGDLALVGATMGDVREIDVSGQAMILQSGAFLASYPAVELDTKWQGLRGFLSERDFIMLRASGQGKLWASSFGGIIEMDIPAGKTLSVDTGHLVAFPDTMQFSVRRVGNWKSTFLSGEGLVTDLTGPGKILIQTRHLPQFVQTIIPYLPHDRN